MEMKRIQSGKLRAVGYDSRARILRVELDGGSLIEYAGVGDEVWRRLASSGAAWSYYRDVVEEEFSGRPVAAGGEQKADESDEADESNESDNKRSNPLDALFK